MLNKRTGGILLHITSLPSPYGIGDLGHWAYKFSDFLNRSGQSFWQILPLNPTDTALGNSPYSSASAFAANPLLISIDFLIDEGFLDKKDTLPLPYFPKGKVCYPRVIKFKKKLINKAYKRFKEKISHPNNNTHLKDQYYRFCQENSYWLEDFSLFASIKDKFGGKSWSSWPKEIKDRKSDIIKKLKKNLKDRMGLEKFSQYLFLKQWLSLKEYCNHKGIYLIGDIPIYINYDSVDVWSHPEIFKLDNQRRPAFVSGVPPDYFSKTGQLWGNPVYNWDMLKKDDYQWWLKRLEHNLKLFNLFRIDHFRGFVSYWEIPADKKTAVEGRWAKGPGEHFFNVCLRHFPSFPIIAEDLGIITQDVKDILINFKFPGMKVLLFAFGEDNPDHPYLPHNYEKNCVVYTGTHDNNTAKGWFEKEAKTDEKKRLSRYIGRKLSSDSIHWELIRLAMMSVANTAIFPMQDILGSGNSARMNHPSTIDNNWRWRLLSEKLTRSELSEKLCELTKIYGRTQNS